MSAINLTIDGREVEAAPGITILQAARDAGIDIPTFCHDPDLSPSGACRICVVEVEKARALVASCSTPVSPGMVVHTESERVIQARRVILRLILANHPLDCMICEKTGQCKLQDYCYRYGVSAGDFGGEVKQLPLDDTNPFFIRDMNKCILCGRCVGKCQEINGTGAIDFTGRGFATNVSPAFGDSIEKSSCNFCGMCVDACPVGALIPKAAVGQGRPWEIQKVRTVCPYCGTGCGLYLHVKEGRVIGASPDFDSPVNRGHLCVKGRFGWDFIHSPERLTTPLVRKGGKLVETDWGEALQAVVEGLSKIRDCHGAESLAGLSSAKASNEENYLFQKLIRSLGSNNVDHCARLCHAPTGAGLALSFGCEAMTNSIEEITGADVLLVIGSNTTETHPVISYRIREAVRRGAKLIVADPREIDLTEIADYHLRLHPGTDVALINAMINVIIDEDLLDTDFIRDRTEGFEEMKAEVSRYTPERVETFTGVPASLLRSAAHLYGTAEKAAILYTMGVTQHTSGTDNVISLANLSMVTGNIGKPSTGVNPLRGQNNVQGACDMGALPGVFTGYQKIDDPEARKKFSSAWGVSLNACSGMAATRMMEAILEKKIKGMYIMGENPVLSEANTGHSQEALRSLEFLVVQDIFLTDTARMADVVLPAAAWAEKLGTYTNTERRVQLSFPAVDPPEKARPDWKILTELGRRLGFNWDYRGPEDIFAEITGLTPSYGGLSYRRLRERGIQWPCPEPAHPGTTFLHEGKFMRGRGLFTPAHYRPPAEKTCEDFPFLLSTGRHAFHYHTGTMSRQSAGLEEHRPEERVQINPLDAQQLGLQEGDWVEITSRRGAVKARITITDRVNQGTAFMTFHYREAAANRLTNNALDPVASTPEYKVCAVKIRKID